MICLFGVLRMNKKEIGRFEKSFLKNYASLSMVFLVWSTTLLFYMMFRYFFGDSIDFYNLGILAGMTGGLWGYAMNRIGQLRDMISSGRILNTSESCIFLYVFSTIVMICSLLFMGFFKNILTFFNLN